MYVHISCKIKDIPIIFNNAKCKILTPKLVAKAHGLYLHQFKWTKEKLIGALPGNWNILVGEQKIPKKINALGLRPATIKPDEIADRIVITASMPTDILVIADRSA